MFEGVCEPTVAGVQAADPFALAAALSRVSEHELCRLGVDDAECVIAATQRVANAMHAHQQVAIDRISDQTVTERAVERNARVAGGRGMLVGAPSPEQEAAASLAPILRIAPRTMLTRIETGRWLALLPRTAALAWAGDLEAHRVSAICATARRVGLEQLAEFEARLHHIDIRELAGSRLKSRVSRIAARLATECQAPEAAPTALVERNVRLCPHDEPGLTRWEAVLPTDVSGRMWEAIGRLAADYRAANPELTISHSRADALAELVLSDVHVSTTVTIVLPAEAALLPSDACAGTPPSGRPRPASPAPGHDASPAGPVAPDPAEDPAGQSVHTALCTGDANPAGAGEALAEPTAGLPRAPRQGGPAVVVPPVNPPPICQCGGRLRSWADVLDFTNRNPVQLNLPSQPGNGHPLLPEQDEEPALEGRVALLLQGHLDVAANPHLRHDHAGQIWFVPGVVTTPPTGTLLPHQLAAILADPDLRIRLAVANRHTGAVEHLDERTYRPGAALARQVRARDGTCRFPGCSTTADRCDLDHVVRHPDGPTSAANLQALCRVHHGFKHLARWQVTMTADGICTWTAPNGRSHTTHPTAIHDDAA